MEVQLAWKQGNPPPGTVDAEALQPQACALTELASRAITIGNRSYRWSDVFEISGEPSDSWTIPGCNNYLNLALGMKQGTLKVEGHAGDYAGRQMQQGGKLQIAGDAGQRLGASLRGGLITVAGNVGAEAGGPAPDSFDGMTDGEIIIHGSAGPRAGFRMRRGLLAMQQCEEFAGYHLQAGTIVVVQGPLPHPGLGMKRGTIICLDPTLQPAWLPYYQPDCIFRPVIVQMILGRLATLNFPFPPEARQARYQLYSGDRLVNGKGEIFSAGVPAVASS